MTAPSGEKVVGTFGMSFRRALAASILVIGGSWHVKRRRVDGPDQQDFATSKKVQAFRRWVSTKSAAGILGVAQGESAYRLKLRMISGLESGRVSEEETIREETRERVSSRILWHTSGSLTSNDFRERKGLPDDGAEAGRGRGPALDAWALVGLADGPDCGRETWAWRERGGGWEECGGRGGEGGADDEALLGEWTWERPRL